jgi:hypothetical protein
VHLTLGILRTSQAVFYALSFFWLDGFAVPAPAQVTQTVSVPLRENLLGLFQNCVSFKLGLSLSNQVSGFRKSFGLSKSFFLAVAIF